MAHYPRWSDLAEREQALVNNGCGPSWLHWKLKDMLNRYLMAWLYHASCGHHDYGYIIGGGEFRRLYCDYRLTLAMFGDLRICMRNQEFKDLFIGFFAAIIFSLSVLFFGWLSFHYGPPKSNAEVMGVVKTGEEPGLLSRLRNFRFYS